MAEFWISRRTPERGRVMLHTIKEAAELTGLTPVTLRYYDREGLLPFMRRSGAGYRMFSDDDIAMLRVIECLKKTGMPIKDIRQFCEWAQAGDSSLRERHEMFVERKHVVEAQMAELQETLDFINHKCWYYETALEAGTEKIHLKGGTGGVVSDGDLPCEPRSVRP